MVPHRCDPHPVRRPGAARSPGGKARRSRRVAILTRSEDRVQRLSGSAASGLVYFELRSSPGPKTGCSRVQAVDVYAELLVAILTRSEDRVQLHTYSAVGGDILVAILTRSEDRVQRGRVAVLVGQGVVAILTRSEDRVQPVPGRGQARRSRRCDPHPVRRPGAAQVSEVCTVCRPRCCDPHPVRRPGAACRPVGKSPI